MQTFCLLGILAPASLLFLIFLASVASLNLQMSFNELGERASVMVITNVVRYAMENPTNLPSITRLAKHGNNGLHEALKSYCSQMSGATLKAVLKLCLGDVEMQLIVFTALCVRRLLLKDHGPEVEGRLRQLLHYQVVHEIDPAKRMDRLAQLDPSGRWWLSEVAWLNREVTLEVQQHYYASPLFQVGMLEFFQQCTVEELFHIYAGMLSLESGNRVKKMWSLYGLMRLSRHPACNKHVFEAVAHKIRAFLDTWPPSHSVARITRLWLCIHKGERCDYGSASTMLLKMIRGRSAIVLVEKPPVYTYALFSIVAGSNRSLDSDQFLDNIDSIFSHSDDHDLATLLWHALLLPHGHLIPDYSQQLLSIRSIRVRLLNVGPSRIGGSLLLVTGLGIRYFRRWIRSYASAVAYHGLKRAEDEREMRQAVLSLPWKDNIPFPTLLGTPVRHNLKSHLEYYLALPMSPFAKVRFPHRPNRVWITMHRPPPSRGPVSAFHAAVLKLVLRLRLHHEEDDQQTVASAPDEIIYDFCTDVLDFFRQPSRKDLWPEIAEPMNIVYPPLKDEDYRSRDCAASPPRKMRFFSWK